MAQGLGFNDFIKKYRCGIDAIAKSLESTGHAEAIAEGSQKKHPRPRISNTRKQVLKFNSRPQRVGDKAVSEAHGKELNVLTSYRLNNFKKKAAFTLAEVLITLGIIGVVAAMTIPTLIANYQEKQTVSRLTKAYATISNAYQMARTEYGDLYTWGFTERSSFEIDDSGQKDYQGVENSKLFLDKLAPYLKVVKRISKTSSWNDYDFYLLDGEKLSSIMPSDILFLADGTTVFGGWIDDFKCTDKGGYCGDFYIDINGIDNLPNKFGQDIFSFEIYKNSIKPTGTKDTLITARTFNAACNPQDTSYDKNGYGCTAWVIYNKNMDYLKCDDLSWDDKHKCN